MKVAYCVAAMLCLVLTNKVRSQPLTSVFTYQGELRSGGSLAAGPYDFRFRLFDSAIGGTQIGAMLCSDNVVVADGRFTVSLDFGTVFTGQQRFLEMEVRADGGLDCANATGFVVLGSRQTLMTTPHAAFSLNAGTATTAATATNSNQLNGQPATFYQNAANLTTGLLPIARLESSVARINTNQTFTGVMTFSNLANSFVGAFSGSGSGLTGVNADLLDGMDSMSLGRLSGVQTWTGANSFANATNLFTGSGAGLTGLNASNLASGTLGDLRLSSNVALLNSLQTFNATKTFSTAPAFTAVGTPFTVTSLTKVTNLNVDLLDGIDSTAFLQSIPNPLVLTGNSGPVIRAQLASGSPGIACIQGNGGNFAVYGQSDYPDAYGVYGVAASGTAGVFGTTGNAIGRGVYGFNNANSGVAYGVMGRSDSPVGTAVFGLAENHGSTTTYGVHGVSNSSQGCGVFGQATSTSGVTYGGWFQNASASGSGLIGVAFASSGDSSGIYGESGSTNGAGVNGYASAASGATYGGKFHSRSAQGFGAFISGVGPDAMRVENIGSGRGMLVNALSDTAIWAITNTGLAGLDARNSNPTGFAMFGVANSTSGVNYGAVGQTYSPSGWGVYSWGNSGASGVKAFRIDHPTDPENKYLLHYASESPMPQNFYVGNVVTDADGRAWVELPEYFNEINVNFKYQLTVVDGPNSDEGDFVQVKVRQKIKDGSFLIMTSVPNTEVSWRVDADRNDKYVRNRKPQDVVEKQGPERGKYQHPELYGLPPERGMYSPERLPALR